MSEIEPEPLEFIMKTDILNALREVVNNKAYGKYFVELDLIDRAANEIERLRAKDE